jgi:hypothetical protein
MGEAKRRQVYRRQQRAHELRATLTETWLAFMCLPARQQLIAALRPIILEVRVSGATMIAERLSHAGKFNRGRFVGAHPRDSAMAKTIAQVTNDAARGRRFAVSATAVLAAAAMAPPPRDPSLRSG